LVKTEAAKREGVEQASARAAAMKGVMGEERRRFADATRDEGDCFVIPLLLEKSGEGFDNT
jgi:hypothetical protein